MPKSKSAEFFGFFSVSEKFAGIAGPFVFAIVSQYVGQSRLSIVSLIIFFIIGAAILSRVNVDEGLAVAEKEETRILETTTVL